MIQTGVGALIQDELRSLPFIDERTVAYQPQEREQMRTYLFYNPDDGICHRACVGFVLNDRKSVLEIHRVGVHEAFQGCGWGRAIVDCLERIAQACGYDRIRLKKNKNPAFWKHLGYRNDEKVLTSSPSAQATQPVP